MCLSFAEKAICTKKIDFPKIRYKNVQHFNFVHAHKPKFGLVFFCFFFCDCPFWIFFLVPFLSFFSALLLLLPFVFHILSGCCKKLGVNYGQSLEMDGWGFCDIQNNQGWGRGYQPKPKAVAVNPPETWIILALTKNRM